MYYESVKQTQQRPNKRGIQAAPKDVSDEYIPIIYLSVIPVPHDYHFHSSVREGVLLWAKLFIKISIELLPCTLVQLPGARNFNRSTVTILLGKFVRKTSAESVRALHI